MRNEELHQVPHKKCAFVGHENVNAKYTTVSACPALKRQVCIHHCLRLQQLVDAKRRLRLTGMVTDADVTNEGEQAYFNKLGSPFLELAEQLQKMKISLFTVEDECGRCRQQDSIIGTEAQKVTQTRRTW
jgi:hypothetical protein